MDIDSKIIDKIINEDEKRVSDLFAPFNPITGENSIGERVKFVTPDYPIPVQYLPKGMMKEPFVKALKKAGSVDSLIIDTLREELTDMAREKVIEQFIRIRNKYDYPFWAATFVYIKRKGGGPDTLFRLNYPQRILVSMLENMRLTDTPIRIVLLKARQWGGSTCIQLYIAWFQLVHEVGLNSLIVAHLKVAADEINDMFDRMMKSYPASMLHEINEAYQPSEAKLVGVGKSGMIHRVPQRNCKIKIGSAERPDSARGGDYSCVHCSEVGLWKTTEKKTPEQIIRSACSGLLYQPMTLIVYESTADGHNFFYDEYQSAKEGKSQFSALFIAWFQIEQYFLEFRDEKERREFAVYLYENRNSDSVSSDREEPGKYLWWLWNKKGASLEAVNWYVHERSKFTDHSDMAAEYPSDDLEAFSYSGQRVFNEEEVEGIRSSCKPPVFIGEIYGAADEGENALYNLRLAKEDNGCLSVWENVEKNTDNCIVKDRYIVSVDVCKGHTTKADFAVIRVFDRFWMMDGGVPALVAQWYGHIDMDKLAWKATQIAEYYNHALLVIESNTLETNNTKGEAEYILNLIRDVYDNLYARSQSAEDIKQGIPRKYGFHTNVVTKPLVILNLKYVVRERLYVERDKGCCDEMITYRKSDKGVYEADEGHHDDKLMATAIGLYVCYNEMELPRIVTKEDKRASASASSRPVSEAVI